MELSAKKAPQVQQYGRQQILDEHCIWPASVAGNISSRQLHANSVA